MILTIKDQNIRPALHRHYINWIRFGSHVACRAELNGQWNKDSTDNDTVAGTRHVTTEQDQGITFKSMNTLFFDENQGFVFFFEEYFLSCPHDLQ